MSTFNPEELHLILLSLNYQIESIKIKGAFYPSNFDIEKTSIKILANKVEKILKKGVQEANEERKLIKEELNHEQPYHANLASD